MGRFLWCDKWFQCRFLSQLQPEDQLSEMYRLIEEEAEKYLEKKHCFKKSGEKKRFIPDNVRKC